MLVAVICGATAAGKSALALRLARANGFEIISADSRQIYRGLRVGTNAPSPEDLSQVKHHLLGFLDPSESFSPREFPARVNALLEENPRTEFLLVGGSGLYLKALLYPSARDRGPTPEAVRLEVKRRLDAEGPARLLEELGRIDPEGARGLHPNDAYRISKRWENALITGEGYAGFAGAEEADPRFGRTPVLWLDADRETLYQRIDARTEEMVRAGWLEETKGLMQRPDWESLPAASSLGYREMAEVIAGTKTFEQAVREIQRRTRKYAKRQLTFFRHQLPTAARWDTEALAEALQGCAWNWEAFAKRNPAPITPRESGTSGASDP
jgi:tRNA dimethylallyltransferase